MICLAILLPLTIILTLFLPILQQIATTVCNWVSSVISTVITVINQVCSWLPWPLDKLCNWVSQLVTVLQTVWNWVCNTVIATVFAIVKYILNLVIYVSRIICMVVTILISIPELLVCLAGLSIPKKVRVCIKVLTDAKGVSKVNAAAIEDSITLMRRVYEGCRISVTIDSIERIVAPELLSSTDDSASGLFSTWHSWFTQRACGCCGQVTVFFVDKIQGSSDGFTFWGDNWCRVDANANTDPTIMAHEIGHLMNLWHVSDNNDLMFPTSGPPTNPRNMLTRSQCCVMRTSTFALN